MARYITVPDNAVILNELHVIEFMDPDGEIRWVDMSKANDGSDLICGKRFELAERAKAIEIATWALDLMTEYADEGDEDCV